MQTRTQPQAESAAEVRAAAEAWYRRQVEMSRLALGTFWPAHREWVLEQLREEVRLRLTARGWRARDGR